MKEQIIELKNGTATGYEVSLGPVNLVMARTDTGLVGCGALDIPALDKFAIPAARVSGVKSIDDLLAAELNLVNEAGLATGLQIGMTGRQALETMQTGNGTGK